jgi:hypothetical protein
MMNSPIWLSCVEEFTKEIGWLKAQAPTVAIKCPGIINSLGPILSGNPPVPCRRVSFDAG